MCFILSNKTLRVQSEGSQLQNPERLLSKVQIALFKGESTEEIRVR